MTTNTSNTHPSNKVMTSSLTNWKNLPKTMKWTFLGKWDQDDSIAFSELQLTVPDLQPKQNFVKGDGRARQILSDQKTARKAKSKNKEPMTFASFGGGRPANKGKSKQ